MHPHVAEAKMFEPAMADPDDPDATSPPTDRVHDDDDRLSPLRGILGAILISVPFWVLVGFTLYLLM